MITGDHPLTAKAIGLALGICKEEDEVLRGKFHSLSINLCLNFFLILT